MRLTQILKAPRRVRRVTQIMHACASHGLAFLGARLGLGGYLPAWARARFRIDASQALPDMPARFAHVLEELGPTFVKLGQMLSTRPDLLPEEYIAELRRICHHVAPISNQEARQVIEEELGRPVDELFAEFSADPLAAGSMAQVHAARLHDGTDVVVKVRRPNIERTIDDDLAIMAFLAEQADARIDELRALRLPMLVDEFGRGLRGELNLMTEGAHTNRFSTAFEREPGIMMPKVHWEFATPRVLTLSRIEGRHLDEIDSLPNAAALRPAVARRILDCFLVQVFQVGAFHADPHPGNILVTEDGRVGMVDFGLSARVGEPMRDQLGALLVALGDQQFELAADVLAEIGSLPPNADDRQFTADVAALIERRYSMPIEKVDMQELFFDIMRIVRANGVVLPRDFVLMVKSMVTVTGMVTKLDPDLNIASLAAPYARQLVRDKVSIRGARRALTSNAYHIGMLVRQIPHDLRRFLRRMRRGQLEFVVKHEGLERHTVELDRTGNRLSLSIILAAIIMSSTLILKSEIGPGISMLGGISALGLFGYGVGFVLGLWLVVGIFRSGRI